MYAHRFTVDGRYLDAEGQFTENSEGGSDTCTLSVADRVLKALPLEVQEGSVVRASFDLESKFKGEIAEPPAFDEPTGMWTLIAYGERKRADEATGRLLHQSRDAEQWKRSDSEPHRYSTDDGFDIATRPGVLSLEIPRGEPHGNGDKGKALSWWPQALVTRVAATIGKLRSSTLHQLLIRRGTGPDGAMATDGAAISLASAPTGPTSFDRTLSVPSDQVEMVLEAIAATVALTTNDSRTADETITLRSSGALGAGTHTSGATVTDEDLDELVVTLNVTAASGTNRQIDIDVQTSRDGGQTWRTVGSVSRNNTGSSNVTVSDRLGARFRVKTTITGNSPSYTFSVTAKKVPAGIYTIGAGTDLPGSPVSAEVTLTVDSLSGTNKRLEVEVQTSSDNQSRWRSIGTFQDFTAAGEQTIEVDNVGDRLRLLVRIYGTSSPSFQVDCTIKLGYRRMRTLLREIRVNGRWPTDTMTMQEGFVDVGDELGWDTSDVSSALSLNVLPSDHTGPWSDLFTYWSTGLVDGHWGVYGENDRLTADLWDNAEEVFAYRSFGAVCELTELPTYDDVKVEWRNGKDLLRHVPRVIDPALRYYEVFLADVQNDDALASLVRTALQADVTEPRYHGRVRVQWVFLSPGGPMVPAAYLRAGMKLTIPDFASLRSETFRITDLDQTRGEAVVGVDDTTSHTRYEERARKMSARRAGRKRQR